MGKTGPGDARGHVHNWESVWHTVGRAMAKSTIESSRMSVVLNKKRDVIESERLRAMAAPEAD